MKPSVGLFAKPTRSSLLPHLRQRLQHLRFEGSAAYWEQRYAAGGDSGAGSYGATADFKAKVLNEFVSRSGVTTVLEFGCGDGNQLSLADYPQYIGLDVSRQAIQRCTDKFRGDMSKSFLLYDPGAFTNNGAIQGDATISLDVILHLVEDDVFETYMAHLFQAARNHVVVFSMNVERTAGLGPHNRFRRFTDWVDRAVPTWELTRVVENPEKGAESVADFYFFEKRGVEG